MLSAVLASFGMALLAPLAQRWGRGWAGWILSLGVAGLFVYFVTLVPEVSAGGAFREVHPWVPALGVTLSFQVDGLSLLFALLITGFGALIVVYSGSYLHAHPQQGRFFLLLLLFMASMLGLVLADNVIALFVFWELTSLTSYFLIGFDHERERARHSALQALLVTGTGGLALLVGLLLLSVAAGGTLELSEILAREEAVRAHALYLPIFVLIAFGAFTKSAQFPFHFWLPAAMAGPTPVSAYLHSATMVKAGIYLLARTVPVLGGSPLWTGTLTIVGGSTMLTGALLAVRQTDLKRALAYSTITALGTLTLLLGLGLEIGVEATMIFLLVHALYKCCLFLIAGAVDHVTGTREVLALGGLRRVMPVTTLAAVLASLSMAGVPPLFGFIGKELQYKAIIGGSGVDLVLLAVAVFANAMTVVVAGVVTVRPFFGPVRSTPRTPHEIPPSMLLGPVLLGVAGLLFGIFPGFVANTLLSPAMAAVLNRSVQIELALWHGWDWALASSMVTLGVGIAIYWKWNTVRRFITRADPLMSYGPERAYERMLTGVVRLAEAQTNLLRHGGLRGGLLTIFGVAIALAGWSGLGRHALEVRPIQPEVRIHEWMLAGLIVLGVVITVLSRSRLTAILSLGMIGFLTALWYLLLSAPDLAMTQFLVETLVVVILLLVIPHLPRGGSAEPAGIGARARDGGIALGMGALMTGLLLSLDRLTFDSPTSDYFIRESLPSGHGRNIVNVILVDFRALDTLGEITVLAVAALGASSLLHTRSTRRSAATNRRASVILRSATRLLMPILLLLSAFLLWRGHHEPGGGFIGGLVAAGALALCSAAFGTRAVRRVLRVPPRTLLAAGLGTALVSGLIALTQGKAFLSAQWLTLRVGPQGAPLHLGTPLLFDLGVYLLVVGVTLKLIVALEEV